LEAFAFLRPIGLGMLGFGVLLLAVPVIQVLRTVHPWRSLIGLWVAGVGFIMIGAGLAFADRGWGSAVLPGVIVTVVGHFVQSVASRKSRQER